MSQVSTPIDTSVVDKLETYLDFYFLQQKDLYTPCRSWFQCWRIGHWEVLIYVIVLQSLAYQGWWGGLKTLMWHGSQNAKNKKYLRGNLENLLCNQRQGNQSTTSCSSSTHPTAPQRSGPRITSAGLHRDCVHVIQIHTGAQQLYTQRLSPGTRIHSNS